MEDSFLERLKILKISRSLSTWGPDFNDEITVEAWIGKLSTLPLEILIKSIDKLSGKKEFPSPSDILEIARSEMKSKEISKGECSECQALIRQILRSETWQEFRKRHLGDSSSVYEDLMRKVKLTPIGKCNIELLQRYANNVSEMIFELHWRTNKF